MPTNIVLVPPSHPIDALDLFEADAVSGGMSMFAFSFTGLVAELLALLGSTGGTCMTFLSFCLIACAPALAAVGALRVARTRQKWSLGHRPHSLQTDPMVRTPGEGFTDAFGN
jgi:hypothetical protein